MRAAAEWVGLALIPVAVGAGLLLALHPLPDAMPLPDPARWACYCVDLGTSITCSDSAGDACQCDPVLVGGSACIATDHDSARLSHLLTP